MVAIPVSGNRISGRREVTSIGMASVIHQDPMTTPTMTSGHRMIVPWAASQSEPAGASSVSIHVVDAP